ncbi:hypothetical protein [Prochlorococcus marinus]|uniref:hypothetical protein n=1 Tax=Prochlorococcus marinus TaxID=1219 RepID=UPI000AB4CEC9
MKRDGWLSDYIINYAGKDHLDMKPKGNLNWVITLIRSSNGDRQQVIASKTKN